MARTKMTNKTNGIRERHLGLRVTDPETARVVSIKRAINDAVVGAGILVSDTTVLTCMHVLEAALDHEKPQIGERVKITLIGVSQQPMYWAVIKQLSAEQGPSGDVALLRIEADPKINLSISIVEFATPLRHGGKHFSVFGFPEGSKDQGRNVTGFLHAADAQGLVQMDRGGSLAVEQGYSGAPVWCQDLNAFVGMVVTEQRTRGVSWCIPSRLLCNFYPDLLVRFRIPPSDRPHIHDYEEDDPNIQLFGSVSESPGRKLTAKISGSKKHGYTVELYYTCHKKLPPKGGYVTFITYPDFEVKNREDAYELFSVVKKGIAQTEFYPSESFTVAAIGDAGDTVLTLDLATVKNKPKSFK